MGPAPGRSPWQRLLRGALEPRTLVGLGAGISLLLLLGSIADWREVGALARRLPLALVLAAVPAQLFGTACRTLRWLHMLRASGVSLPWKRAVAAWFGADLLGPLPASPLVASYFLHRSGAATAGATVPVVLAGLWVDAMVVVGGTALVPDAVPGAVRAAGLTLCGGALCGAVLLHLRPAHALVWAAARGVAGLGRRLWWRGERWWRALEALPEWTPRMVAAFSPRVLLPAAALTALPMAVGASLTAAVAASLGFPQLTPPRVWAASGAVMALAIASPLPFDLGVVEGGTVLAYGWTGVPPAAALTVSLLGRMWGAVLGLLLAGGATWALRRELD